MQTMPEQTIPTDESAVAVESTAAGVAETATAEVAETAIDANPHSDLPAAGDISAEIPAVELPAEERPLPFGVYRGTK